MAGLVLNPFLQPLPGVRSTYAFASTQSHSSEHCFYELQTVEFYNCSKC
jgi:hypothetical protein